MYDGIKPEARGWLAGEGICPDCLGKRGEKGEKGCVCEAVEPELLLAYEISESVQLQNGQWTQRPLEWGRDTEAGIERRRKDRVDGFPKRHLTVVWPLAHGRKSTGLSGTLERWMRGQRG